MYRLVLTDLATKPVAELRNYQSFNFQRTLSKVASVSFTVRLDNQQADRLSRCEGFIKVYRNNVLVFYGPLITAEESAERESQNVAVTAADTGWFLSKRLAGKSATGTVYSVATARDVIAKELINAANTDATTNVSTARATSSGSAITYKAGPYRPLLEVISELGVALDGFDWRILPREDWQNGVRIAGEISEFDAQTVIGVNRPNAVFEYGYGSRSNVLSYTKSRTRELQANRVFHIANDPASVVMAEDLAAQTAWKLLEDIVTVEITDAAMRTGLVNEHINVRKNPRDLVRLTPHIDPGATGRLPRPFVDYDIGDTITARFKHGGTVRFSGQLRVYGIRINVEQETGFERVELVLEDET